MCTWISLLVKLRQKATCSPIFYLASILCLGLKIYQICGESVYSDKTIEENFYYTVKSPCFSRLAKGFLFNSFTYWSESIKYQLFVTVKVHDANINGYRTSPFNTYGLQQFNTNYSKQDVRYIMETLRSRNMTPEELSSINFTT